LDSANNPMQTAGTTLFGQFLDHGITFDASSRPCWAPHPQLIVAAVPSRKEEK
jgi:hypothetical protein